MSLANCLAVLLNNIQSNKGKNKKGHTVRKNYHINHMIPTLCRMIPKLLVLIMRGLY